MALLESERCMANTKNLALICSLLHFSVVQQLQFPVLPGTPKGYTAVSTPQLLHTGKADHSCKQCGSPLNGKQRGRAKFCDKKCHGKWLSKHATGSNNPCWRGGSAHLTCLVCKKQFIISRALYRKQGGKYCSAKCSGIARSVYAVNHPFRKGGSMVPCAECHTHFYIQNCEVKRGVKKYCSRKCLDRATARRMAGENHPMWKGGATEITRAIRASTEYKTWRRAVMQRDRFTCQDCKKRGGKLSAHHIRTFSEHESLRFFVPNGITLCWPCHLKLKNKEAQHAERLASKIESLL